MKKKTITKLLVAACILMPTVFLANKLCNAGWTEMSSGTSEILWEVWGSSSNDVFAVGGTILQFIPSDVDDDSIDDALDNYPNTGGELTFLFFYCLADPGRNKLKPLIEEFALFRDLPSHDLVNPKVFQSLYAPQAFK